CWRETCSAGLLLVWRTLRRRVPRAPDFVAGGVATAGARCGPARVTVRRLRAPDFPEKSAPPPRRRTRYALARARARPPLKHAPGNQRRTRLSDRRRSVDTLTR